MGRSRTSEDSAQFADEVTRAYGVPRVKVIVDDRAMEGYTEYRDLWSHFAKRASASMPNQSDSPK